MRARVGQSFAPPLPTCMLTLSANSSRRPPTTACESCRPDPKGMPDRTLIEIGEVWENPMTGECATIVEPSHHNPERRAVADLLARVETMNRLLRQVFLAGLLIALASTSVAAKVCDKGDLFENPFLDKSFGLAVLLGPLLLLVFFRRAWTDIMAAYVAILLILGVCALLIESFVPVDDMDPFVAAMKREGCLWKPGWWHRIVLASIAAAYAAIFHVARKRVMRRSGSVSTPRR